jgi:hypothetical protein
MHKRITIRPIKTTTLAQRIKQRNECTTTQKDSKILNNIYLLRKLVNNRTTTIINKMR